MTLFAKMILGRSIIAKIVFLVYVVTEVPFLSLCSASVLPEISLHARSSPSLFKMVLDSPSTLTQGYAVTGD